MSYNIERESRIISKAKCEHERKLAATARARRKKVHDWNSQTQKAKDERQITDSLSEEMISSWLNAMVEAEAPGCVYLPFLRLESVAKFPFGQKQIYINEETAGWKIGEYPVSDGGLEYYGGSSITRVGVFLSVSGFILEKQPDSYYAHIADKTTRFFTSTSLPQGGAELNWSTELSAPHKLLFDNPWASQLLQDIAIANDVAWTPPLEAA